MKRSQYQRLQKFYSKLEEKDLKDLLALSGKEESSFEIKELLLEELKKRKEKEAIVLASIERRRKYAMCLSRGLATFIDLAIISLPLILLMLFKAFKNFYLKFTVLGIDPQGYHLEGIGLLMPFAIYYAIIFLIYSSFLIAKRGFTLGEQLLNIKIVDYQERPLNFKQAFLRNLFCLIYFIPYLGGGCIFVSIIMCCLNKRRQMLHDILCKNLVLKFKERKEVKF